MRISLSSMLFGSAKSRMPSQSEALPGRTTAMKLSEPHHVFGSPLDQKFPGMEFALFGMGCFWGAERKFWTAKGVVSTAVGYAGGITPNPTYEEVCSGLTGHNEVVRVVWDLKQTRYEELLKIFWENHNPTQGFRQGNDVGTQYRSGIYWFTDEQKGIAERLRDAYQNGLNKNKLGTITTEMLPAPTFYFAETYHQQYLSKNPHGYCGLGGTGVSCSL